MKISEIILQQGINRRFRGPRKPRLKQKGFHQRMKGLLDNEQVNESGSAPGVGAIHHSEIAPTLKRLEKQLGIPLLKNALGSVGKKEFSGDIDIAVQLDKEQQDEFQKRLEQTQGLDFIRKTSVFITSADIVGYDPKKQPEDKERTGKVQIDFMPGDVEFMKHYYHSPHSKGMSKDGRHSDYKGIHRNIMVATMVANLDTKASDETTSDGRPLELERWMFSPSDGMVRVIRRPVEKKNGVGHTKANKNEIIKGPFKNPNDWAKILKLDSADDLYSFETLYAAIKKNYPAKLAQKIFTDYKQNDAIQKAGVPSQLGESIKKPIAESDARIQHIEDLAIWHGTKGIAKSIQTMHNLEKQPEDITVKWDGSPAVIFGRNENGQFVLTDKSGFSAKGYDGKVTSADALGDMLSGRKVKDPTPEKLANRKDFIQKMKNVWSVYEASVPENFRGYVHGDLLYYTKPEVDDGYFEFTPNIVTYRVKQNSKIGQEISRSKAGVVLHAKIELDGSKGKVNVKELNSGDLLIMPPVTVTQAPKIDAPNLDKMASYAKSQGSKIDALLDDNFLKTNKLSSFKNTLYTYVNNMTKARRLNNLAGDWSKWLQQAKLSDAMKTRMENHVNNNADGMNALFKVVTGLMTVKNDIIQQLDNADTDVQAFTDGQRGGEGYVIGQGDSKLVNRSGFSAANMSKER